MQDFKGSSTEDLLLKKEEEERKKKEEEEEKGSGLEPWPHSQPPPSWSVREAMKHDLDHLKTANVHVKHIILQQSGKDLMNCKVACLKDFFQTVSRLAWEG